MLRTRDKRTLVLGVQPVIRDVEPSKDFRNMLSSDPKIRGHMINLKKMLMGHIVEKMRLITSKLLQSNVVIAFGGLDSVNQHFSNKQMHTPFIELVMFKKDFDKEADFDQCKKEAVSLLISEMNEFLILLAGDPTCVITREILRECKSDGGYEGSYFGARGGQNDSGDHHRLTIDFYYNISQSFSYQPFVEIRVLPNLHICTLDKYGIFYMPLGFVHTDIKTGVANQGGPDWTFRESTLKQCVERSGLTFSSWTFNGLLRYCYPGITMKRMKVEEGVKEVIKECFSTAPIHNSGALTKLREVFLSELSKWQDDTILARVLNLETLYERSVILGLLPEGRDLKENLFNEYNKTHVRESRTMYKIK